MVVARVVPDVTGLDKQFDYLVPAALAADVVVGAVVRVELHGRRVTGWIVELPDAAEVAASALKPIIAVVGHGPDATLVDVARWAQVRWAARRLRPFLVAASPRRRIADLPPARRSVVGPPGPASPATTRLLTDGGGVLRLPPRVDVLPSILSAAGRGPVLVVVPTQSDAALLTIRLRRGGLSVASMPDDWAFAAAGVDVVLGTRSAAWAPCPDLAAALLVDEHDDVLQEERSPTWHAREVLAERCRLLDVPLIAISPVPTLVAVETIGNRNGGVVAPPRERERAGWPVVEVIDRRHDEPWKRSLVTSELIAEIRDQTKTVVCVSNITGRARLMACRSCQSLIRCEHCDAAVGAGEDGRLRCRRCGSVRPPVCQVCGAGRFANLRPGVARLREELEAAAARRVVAVTGTDVETPARAGVYIGTEAVLHRLSSADVVVFLEFDAEMLAPRFRASEQALALLVRAGRLAPRVMVQTFDPEHVVIRAAVHGNPDLVVDVERARRRMLRLPPFGALALVSGSGAGEFIASLAPGTDVAVLDTDRFVVRAADHDELAASLEAGVRPPGTRLRIEVDPARV